MNAYPTPSTPSRGRKRKADGEPPPPQGSSPHKAINIDTTPLKLGPARQKLIRDFSHIPQKPLLDFFETYVPSVSDAVVDAIMKDLETIGKITHSGRVYGYATKTPAEMRTHENEAFKHLGRFIETIIEAVVKFEKRSNDPCIAHKQRPLAGEKASSSIPDSYVYLLEKVLGCHGMGWGQLLAVGEFKKHRMHEKDVCFVCFSVVFMTESFPPRIGPRFYGECTISCGTILAVCLPSDTLWKTTKRDFGFMRVLALWYLNPLTGSL
jgi:hypothetical protein